MSGVSPGTPQPAPSQDSSDGLYCTPPPQAFQNQVAQLPLPLQAEPMRTSPPLQSCTLSTTQGDLGSEDDDMLFGPEDQPEDDDYSPPFGVYVAYRNEEQVSASLPVFSSSLSTLAAFLTEPLVARRLRTFAKNSDTFDSILVPIFNNLRSLVNQWNSIIDDDVCGLSRGNDIQILRPVTAPVHTHQPAAHMAAIATPTV